MASDRILLLGFGSDKLGTPENADKTAVLLTKLGYEVITVPPGLALPDFVASERVDGILLESSYTEAFSELIEFLRSYDGTRNVPIITVIDRPRQLHEIKERKYNRIELIQKPASIGVLASRIAISLRVRKIEGSDRARASLGDMNASLRDVNDRLSKEREEAKRIQVALLPLKVPQSELFDLAVEYIPLEDVGGDWYYYGVESNGGVNFQIADITGHGLSAAFIGSMTKLALTASKTTQPSELLASMNKLMLPVLPEGRFVTMGSFAYDPNAKSLVAAYAGHPAGLIWRASQSKLEELKSPGFPLGFEETAQYAEKKTNVESGDILIAFTDGLSEALNRANVMFGLPQITKVLQEAKPEETSAQLMKRLLTAFHEFREDRILKDDVTVIILKIK